MDAASMVRCAHELVRTLKENLARDQIGRAGLYPAARQRL